MVDPAKLRESVLGSVAPQQQGGNQQQGGQPQQGGGGLGAILGHDLTKGAIGGGILGLLLGSKKGRKVLGGGAQLAGAAVIGGLAYKAFQDYRARQAATSQVGTAPPPLALPAPSEAAFDPAHMIGTDGGDFRLSLVRAMIAAANADGHIDRSEQDRLFAEIGKMELDAEAKSFVFDELNRPADAATIAGLAAGPEQAAELYLASRLTIDPDDVRERAYLDLLASRLALPPGLIAELDARAGSLV